MHNKKHTRTTGNSIQSWHMQHPKHHCEKHPDITLVHSNSVKVNGDGEELKKIDYSIKESSGILFDALARRTGGINTPSHLYRRSIFSEIGYYDPTFSFEDTLLENKKCKLSAQGTIVASIPNVRYYRVLTQILLNRDFKYEKSGVMDETHMRFFTQKSIARMFADAGYKIVPIVPINKGSSIRPLFYKAITLGLIGGDISYPQIAVAAQKASAT